MFGFSTLHQIVEVKPPQTLQEERGVRFTNRSRRPSDGNVGVSTAESEADAALLRDDAHNGGLPIPCHVNVESRQRRDTSGAYYTIVGQLQVPATDHRIRHLLVSGAAVRFGSQPVGLENGWFELMNISVEDGLFADIPPVMNFDLRYIGG